jgi:aminopeptidase 2
MCRGNAEVQSGGLVPKAREVLPTNVKPTHYDLTLEADFEKFTFDGTVVIE